MKKMTKFLHEKLGTIIEQYFDCTNGIEFADFQLVRKMDGEWVEFKFVFKPLGNIVKQEDKC